jgi:hypothetical protein
VLWILRLLHMVDDPALVVERDRTVLPRDLVTVVKVVVGVDDRARPAPAILDELPEVVLKDVVACEHEDMRRRALAVKDLAEVAYQAVQPDDRAGRAAHRGTAGRQILLEEQLHSGLVLVVLGLPELKEPPEVEIWLLLGRQHVDLADGVAAQAQQRVDQVVDDRLIEDVDQWLGHGACLQALPATAGENDRDRWWILRR